MPTIQRFVDRYRAPAANTRIVRASNKSDQFMVGMQIRLLIEPCKIAMVHTLLCFVDLIVAAVLPNFVLNGFFRFLFEFAQRSYNLIH